MTARGFFFDPDLLATDSAARDAACGWFRANGVDPSDIPVTAIVVVDGDELIVRGGGVPERLRMRLAVPMPELAALRPMTETATS